MTPPLIGITGERLSASQVASALPVQHGFDGDWFYADYARAIREAGGLPIYLPIDDSVNDYLAVLDGVILSGGGDIDPVRYGQSPAPETQAPDAARDQFELDFAAGALNHGLPTLGICRGIQLINVLLGGTVTQHVPTHAFVDGAPDDLTHVVGFATGSRLHARYGASIEVNSLHHQAVDELGTDLVAVGTSPDGGIEAIEHKSKPVVCLLYTSPSPRDRTRSRMPSSA